VKNEVLEQARALNAAADEVARIHADILEEISAGLSEGLHPGCFRDLLLKWAEKNEMGDLTKLIRDLNNADAHHKNASLAFRKALAEQPKQEEAE
jgi:hypothetical protein